MFFCSRSIPTGPGSVFHFSSSSCGSLRENEASIRILQPQASFPSHFGNIEPSLQSLEDRKTAQENLLENLRAKRNVGNIIFHHGISTHCWSPVSQQEELHHIEALGLRSVGMRQGPSPSRGMCRVSGVTVHASPGMLAPLSV